MQFINKWALNIVFNRQTLNYHPSINRDNLKFLKCPSVLSSVISIDNAKDLQLSIELIEKTLHIFLTYHRFTFLMQR